MIHDIARFFRGHWPHLVVAAPAAVAFTALHEFAHCVAVWLQGGRVTAFVWLPSAGEWGHMRYVFAPEASYSEAAIALSPYLFWASFCLLAGLLALRRRPWPYWVATFVFVWLFLVPLADTANASVPYLLWDAENDFRGAFGPVRPRFTVLAVLAGAAILPYGYWLNKRLYRERAVGLAAYGALAATAGLAVLAAVSARFA